MLSLSFVGIKFLVSVSLFPLCLKLFYIDKTLLDEIIHILQNRITMVNIYFIMSYSHVKL